MVRKGVAASTIPVPVFPKWEGGRI